jgi:hypothetical protein
MFIHGDTILNCIKDYDYLSFKINNLIKEDMRCLTIFSTTSIKNRRHCPKISNNCIKFSMKFLEVEANSQDFKKLKLFSTTTH